MKTEYKIFIPLNVGLDYLLKETDKMMSKLSGYALCYKSNRDGEVWWHYTYDTYQQALAVAKNLFAGDKDYTWWIDDLSVK